MKLKKRKMTVLEGLKRYMKKFGVSVVDLDWKKLGEHKISMPKLLRWELKNGIKDRS